jgi:hypothetical protein
MRTRDFVLWGLAHALLALGMVANPTLSLVHAAVVVGLGAVACLRASTAETALVLAGYVATCEVLWRMTDGAPFWEYSKYACALLLLLALTRLPARRTPTASGSILFVALLLPSVPLTLGYLDDSGEIRRAVSFYLAGPVCLAVAAAVLSQVRPADFILPRALLWLSFPILGIAAVALRSTVTAESIVFITESNLVTSGHYGPNQVSGILGFGALSLLVCALVTRRTGLRVVATLTAIWLTGQAVLTLSRGGVASAALGAFVFVLHTLPNRRARVSFALAGALIAGLLTWVVVPGLNRFTEGTLEERYTEWDTTGRAAIARADLELWSDHLVLGVGPGMSPRLRGAHPGTAAHTEFTRMVAEHGLLGATAILILLVMAGRAYLRAPSSLARGFAAACTVWSVSEMIHSAMRLTATAFAFGLAMLGTDRLGAMVVRQRRRPGRAAIGRAAGAATGGRAAAGIGGP